MCAGPGSMKISVEPHQIITIRSTLVLIAERADVLADVPRASARLLIGLHVRAVEALHVARVERRLHRTHRAQRLGDGLEVPARPRARPRAARRRTRRRGRDPSSRTRGRRGFASGTKSRISGTLCSVRFPSRIVPICVSEPIGSPIPRLASSTPATSVLATAPMPTVSTPRRPSTGFTTGGWTIGRSAGVMRESVGGRSEPRVAPRHPTPAEQGVRARHRTRFVLVDLTRASERRQ